MSNLISYYLNKNQSDKCYSHSYQLIYDEFFQKFNRDLPLDILEVGVEKGGSLLAWKEYFPNAHVIGVDIAATREYIDSGVQFVLSDIKKYQPTNSFDIIIEDGSHSNEDALWAVEHLTKHLKIGGTLFIEDVQEGFIVPVLAWGKLLGKFMLTAIDMRRITGAHDNFLIKITRHE